MDVSYAHQQHTWELSDSESSFNDDHDNSPCRGSINTIESSEDATNPPIAEETTTAANHRSVHSESSLDHVRKRLDVEIDSLGLEEITINSGHYADHASYRMKAPSNDSDSDSASGGSSSGGLFVSFSRDERFPREEEFNDNDEDGYEKGRPSVSCGDLPVSGSNSTSQGRYTSSKAVITSLKKSWKMVKKTGARGTASAGKSLSSLSSTYFSASRAEPTREAWEERHSRMGDEWLNVIIPAWRKKKKTARVRTLVFRGIPANVRGRVWQCAIGNPLNVSQELFEVLKERGYAGRMEYIRGRETVALADGDVGGDGGRAEGMLEHERSAHKAIMLDLPRTFPELSFFHAEGSHYEDALRDVLEAFLYLKPDVGYSQGMSFLAAVLLLYMDPYEAFSCFVNMLLHKSCFLHFFKMKMPEVRFYMTVHERLLNEEMPSLHAHFTEHSIQSDLYMINWVMSLYCHALPLDLVTRIWDLYVLDGDIAIFRSALGILKLFQSRLLRMKFEELAYFLSHIPSEEIQADALLQSIRSVRVVTRKRFRDLLKECELTRKAGGGSSG